MIFEFFLSASWVSDMDRISDWKSDGIDIMNHCKQ